MTAPTWADRSLPLADSVRDAILAAMKANRWTPSDEDTFWATADELLADIAAADRLARDVASYHDALETWQADGSRPWKDVGEGPFDTFMASLVAYRARMQGVANGR